ncbi:type VII secretion target [Nocardia sp. NPDC101769]|uniref:type VII secretion target n=1 Tax=Nocardia sp. NPDC101769 TaxID=3364333 RepID=UPI00381C8953
MADNVSYDLAAMEQLALHHEARKKEISDWSQKPHDWLDTFLATYGNIAYKVHDSLHNYYDARYTAGQALADHHQKLADNLRTAAKKLDDVSGAGAAAIRGVGSGNGSPTHVPIPTGGPSLPAGPVSGPVTPVEGQPPVGSHPTAPVDAQHPVGSHPTAPSDSGAPAGGHGPGSSTSAVTPDLSAASMEQGSEPGSGSPVGGSTVTGAPFAGPVDASSDPSTMGPVLPSAGDPSSNQSADAPTADGDDAASAPLLTPFAAAVAAAKDKAAAPAFVVNETTNEDLVLARTLLGAVLAAADSPAVGLAWAVSVMRGPAGTRVFITSNEGRGWLPAGIYLPREVSTPWAWDDMLAADGGSPWEGVADPARILAEFALAWGSKSDTGLSALVSSAPIDASLRGAFPDVVVEDMVAPVYDVDLRNPTPDTLDRLALSGSATALEDSAAVPDSAIRRRRVELATAAHAGVGRALATPPEALSARTLRGRVLDAIEAGHPVPAQLWQDLRDADDLLAAAMLSRRVDAGRVELGRLRIDDEAEVLRTMVFERRCTELALLLADEPTRQTLRDALYASEQIMSHPRYLAIPTSSVRTPAERAVVHTDGATTPPTPTGPPRGAIVGPSDAPAAPVPTDGQ